MDFDVLSGDFSSFYSVAEFYLGKRKEEIPKWKQAEKQPVKQVKKKKRKRI
ncbi:hypothetical protein [Bacillus sp. 1P02SD]|uniref:hypothetical protein n=1 Tax=Bacillus sp. 1P02SD TaxID=3132264 RepID=UPI0039A36653